MRRLRTLSSVLNVTPFVLPTDSGNVLTYQIKERWTLLPVGDFGVTEKSFWIGAGAMESNLFGRGVYAYAYLEYGTPYAYHFILRSPYLLSSKWGVEAISRISNESENWKFLQNENFYKSYISLAAKYEFRFEKDIYFGLKLQEEKLLDNVGDDLITLDSRQVMVGFVKLIWQKIDNRYFYLDGWKNYFLMEQLLPISGDKPVFMVRDDLYFFRHYNKTNLAFRMSIGLSNETEAGYLPFTTDSYNNIRGSGYREYKGNRIGTINCEYRYTIFENNYSGIQVLAFTDMGNIKATIKNTIHEEDYLFFAGTGFRLIFKKAYNAVLSIDYGMNVQNPVQGSFVIGWGQYF